MKIARVWRAIKGTFSATAAAEDTIQTQVDIYLQTARENPSAEPHELLASTWLSRIAMNGHDVDNEQIHMTAFAETQEFAAIPPPGCARALGLYILYKEDPKAVASQPRLQMEFATLMKPVRKAVEDGTFDELYASNNPRLAAEEPD